MIKNASPILSALKAATMNETAAVEFIEAQRWPNGIACPRCGSASVYKMLGRDGQRNKDFRLRCKDCKRMFTVRTNTVFEETRLPLKVWVYAFYRACASKKGFSALQLSRETEISYKSALFVLRRIRHGVGAEHARKLRGTVEADETYIGGKPRFPRTKPGPNPDKPKAPVMGIVERNGELRLRMMQRLTADRVVRLLQENADGTCRVITDESSLYLTARGSFRLGSHETVNHSRREYARGDVNSNTVESVFSLIKRGVMGTFHSVSRKHLPNYLNEFEFRWNTRKADDGARVAAAFRAVNGKRLEYRESVDNPPYLVPAEPKQADAPFQE